MRPSQLLAAVLAMSSVTVAMTDAFDNIHGLEGVKDVLFGRQNNDGMSDAMSTLSCTDALCRHIFLRRLKQSRKHITKGLSDTI